MTKGIQDIRTETKLLADRINDFRTKKDLEVLRAYIYKAYGGTMLHLYIYDKKLNKVFAGNIGLSGYDRKKTLEMNKPKKEKLEGKE